MVREGERGIQREREGYRGRERERERKRVRMRKKVEYLSKSVCSKCTFTRCQPKQNYHRHKDSSQSVLQFP